MFMVIFINLHAALYALITQFNDHAVCVHNGSIAEGTCQFPLEMTSFCLPWLISILFMLLLKSPLRFGRLNKQKKTGLSGTARSLPDLIQVCNKTN